MAPKNNFLRGFGGFDDEQKYSLPIGEAPQSQLSVVKATQQPPPQPAAKPPPGVGTPPKQEAPPPPPPAPKAPAKLADTGASVNAYGPALSQEAASDSFANFENYFNKNRGAAQRSLQAQQDALLNRPAYSGGTKQTAPDGTTFFDKGEHRGSVMGGVTDRTLTRSSGQVSKGNYTPTPTNAPDPRKPQPAPAPPAAAAPSQFELLSTVFPWLQNEKKPGTSKQALEDVPPPANGVVPPEKVVEAPGSSELEKTQNAVINKGPAPSPAAKAPPTQEQVLGDVFPWLKQDIKASEAKGPPELKLDETPWLTDGSQDLDVVANANEKELNEIEASFANPTPVPDDILGEYGRLSELAPNVEAANTDNGLELMQKLGDKNATQFDANLASVGGGRALATEAGRQLGEDWDILDKRIGEFDAKDRSAREGFSRDVGAGRENVSSLRAQAEQRRQVEAGNKAKTADWNARYGKIAPAEDEIGWDKVASDEGQSRATIGKYSGGGMSLAEAKSSRPDDIGKELGIGGGLPAFWASISSEGSGYTDLVSTRKAYHSVLENIDERDWAEYQSVLHHGPRTVRKWLDKMMKKYNIPAPFNDNLDGMANSRTMTPDQLRARESIENNRFDSKVKI